MTIYPDLPYDAAGGHGASRVSTQMVVIHATGQTASDEAEAHYAEHRSDHTSAHFYSDDDSVIQALDTGLIAYGCYPIGNSRSIQFEITGVSDHISDAALRRVAPIVARVCEQYGIPIRHVGPAELRRGTKGISGHADVTAAWREGDHTDPGPNFPWTAFLAYVQAAATPAAMEDDMPAYVTGQLAAGFAETADGAMDTSKVDMITAPAGRKAGMPWGDMYLRLGCDLGSARVRVAVHSGAGWDVQTVDLNAADGVHAIPLVPVNGDGMKISLARVQRSATDTADSVPVSWMVELAAR